VADLEIEASLAHRKHDPCRIDVHLIQETFLPIPVQNMDELGNHVRRTIRLHATASLEMEYMVDDKQLHGKSKLNLLGWK
jgi:hypothetical protein